MSSPKITLTPADNKSLHFWVQQTQTDPAAHKWLNICTSYEKWVNVLGATRYVLEASTEQNNLVGFVEVDILSSYSEALINYYVNPTHRGYGYGLQLITSVIEWLKNNSKLKVVYAYVDYNNHHSLRVLSSTNFLNQGRVKNFVVFSYILNR